MARGFTLEDKQAMVEAVRSGKTYQEVGEAFGIAASAVFFHVHKLLDDDSIRKRRELMREQSRRRKQQDPERFKEIQRRYRDRHREELKAKRAAAKDQWNANLFEARLAGGRVTENIENKYEREARYKEQTPPGMAHRKRWDEAELSYLRDAYATKGLVEIAQALGRTWRSVAGKAIELGLRKKRDRLAEAGLKTSRRPHDHHHC